MHIEPKTQEVMQAQVAAFASHNFPNAGNNIEQLENKTHILGNVGNLASGGVVDVTLIGKSNVYSPDGSIKVPAGTERVAATAQEYTEFLRSVGGSRSEVIAERVKLADAYSTFAPIVAGLKGSVKSSGRDHNKDYLASGSNSDVFKISNDDGSYIVRVPKGGYSSATGVVDSHISGAVLGKGVPHLEQVIAASYEDGVTISEIMPGKPLDKSISLEEIKQITDGQLTQLVGTLANAVKLGINIDPKPDNIFYDPKEGFGIIDYDSINGEIGANYTGMIIGSVGSSLMNMGFFNRKINDKPKTTEDYARDLELRKANMDILHRYRTVVGEVLNGEELQIALEQIDRSIEGWKDEISRYSDPEWVNSQVSGGENNSKKNISASDIW